jgi:hypothetical protein
MQSEARGKFEYRYAVNTELRQHTKHSRSSPYQLSSLNKLPSTSPAIEVKRFSNLGK